MTPLKNIDDDEMVVELGPSAINSDAKPAEDKKTAEKGDEATLEENEVDVVVDYEDKEDNGEENTRNERFLDDHLAKIRNSKTVTYTPNIDGDLMSAVTYETSNSTFVRNPPSEVDTIISSKIELQLNYLAK